MHIVTDLSARYDDRRFRVRLSGQSIDYLQRYTCQDGGSGIVPVALRSHGLCEDYSLGGLSHGFDVRPYLSGVDVTRGQEKQDDDHPA